MIRLQVLEKRAKVAQLKELLTWDATSIFRYLLELDEEELLDQLAEVEDNLKVSKLHLHLIKDV